MTYAVTISGNSISFTMSPVAYSVSLSQSGLQGAAGPAGLSWESAWALSTAYVANDAVSNDGSSYICILAHTATADDEPGVGVNTATYWELLAEKGTDGAVTEAQLETTTINAQTGTTYTLVIGDRGQTVTMDNASANTVTIPTNASVAFDVGSVVVVVMKGAGATTITGATGVTVNGVSAGSVTISAQYQGVSLLKVATDTWIASGAI